MFHAARAALLAAEGSASTNHGRVVETFARMVKGRCMKGEREHAAALEAASKLRIKADYTEEDLTEAADGCVIASARFSSSAETLWTRPTD